MVALPFDAIGVLVGVLVGDCLSGFRRWTPGLVG
jgi:hypothetical protein